jgi:hypothetical protein
MPVLLPALRNRIKKFISRFALAHAAPALFFPVPFARLSRGLSNSSMSDSATDKVLPTSRRQSFSRILP